MRRSFYISYTVLMQHTYVDLSVNLNQQTPVYPGDPAVKIEPAGVLEHDGWNDHYVSLGTHIGTHVDAPLHMLRDGQSLQDIPVDRFVGRGRLIDATDGFSLERVQAAALEAGDIVLFQTDMSKRYHEPVYFETYPVMTKDIADYLVNKKVSMVGVDAGSVDNAEDFPIHKTLLAGGVLIIENLTNLDSLLDKTFTVFALPIKLEIDGAPARVVAQLG